MSRKSMIKPYKHCKKCGALIVSGDLCEDCKPMTNGDKIRAMTDEELAEFFCQISQCCGNDASCSMCPIYDGCAQNVLCVERWLKQCATDTNVGGKGGADNDKT